jgi:hypothetical protein
MMMDDGIAALWRNTARKYRRLFLPYVFSYLLNFIRRYVETAHENIGADAFSLPSLKAKRRSRKALPGIFGARRGENFALSL